MREKWEVERKVLMEVQKDVQVAADVGRSKQGTFPSEARHRTKRNTWQLSAVQGSDATRHRQLKSSNYQSWNVAVLDNCGSH